MSLVPDHDNDNVPKKKDPGYVLHHRNGRTLQPVSSNLQPAKPHVPVHTPAPVPHPPTTPHPQSDAHNPAVELIRRKLDQFYLDEPGAGQEAVEAQAAAPATRSKHQEFMYRLSTSGKSLAQIQTEWHEYYSQLPETEKHEVWQEFYAANERQPSAYGAFTQQQAAQAQPAAHTPPPEMPDHSTGTTPVVATHAAPTPIKSDRRSVADIKKQLLKKVQARSKVQLKAKHHLQSLAFGLGTGALVLLVFLFGFFNELVVTPFIQPSRHAGATPIILNTDGVATSDTPEVIIPKINVQIPIDYNETSIDDVAVERSLDSGILHYPTTVVPGQQGNAAYFGHSSNNIFNSGKYKFAFVLLHELVPGDIFYLTYNKQVYSYRVYDKKIVSPKEVSVLGNVVGKTATATLITCDPPGTSLNRLVVWGEQVSPDPNANSAAPAAAPTVAASAPEQLADNGPTLWKRLTNWATGSNQ
jgi:LPXTG-site transpeptidase (sortase) family protein